MQKTILWFGLEGRLALIGWLGYMTWMVVFCVMHQMATTNNGLDISGSIIWTMREWGFWILVSPTLASSLSKASNLRHPNFARISIMLSALLIALCYRGALGMYQGADSVLLIWVKYLPQYSQLIGLISLAWLALHQSRMMLLPQQADQQQNTPQNSKSVDQGQLNRGPLSPQKLLVSTGSAEALIDQQSICALNAAGNYVEIHTSSESYLVRGTLKGLLQQLPEDQFIRCHRSAAVNIHSIRKVIHFPAGHGELELEDGRKVPVAKSYRKQLKHYRPAA